MWVNGPMLVLYERLSINLPAAPIIVLDSGADSTLIQYLFPGRRLYSYETHAVSPMRLFQVADGKYGVTSLSSNNAKSFISIMKEIKQIATSILARHPDHHFGLITFKALVEHARMVLEDLPFEFGHFWAEKGTNRFSDKGVETLFVVGTPTPALDDLMMKTTGFAWPNRQITLGLDAEWRNYGMTADNKEVTVWKPTDTFVDAFLRQTREFELMQVVGRIRPFTDAHRKTVVVYSALPIPRFPPTAVCSRAELKRQMKVSRRSTAYDTPAPLCAALMDPGQRKTNKELSMEFGVSVRTVQRLRKAAKAGGG